MFSVSDMVYTGAIFSMSGLIGWASLHGTDGDAKRAGTTVIMQGDRPTSLTRDKSMDNAVADRVATHTEQRPEASKGAHQQTQRPWPVARDVDLASLKGDAALVVDRDKDGSVTSTLTRDGRVIGTVAYAPRGKSWLRSSVFASTNDHASSASESAVTSANVKRLARAPRQKLYVGPTGSASTASHQGVVGNGIRPITAPRFSYRKTQLWPQLSSSRRSALRRGDYRSLGSRSGQYRRSAYDQVRAASGRPFTDIAPTYFSRSSTFGSHIRATESGSPLARRTDLSSRMWTGRNVSSYQERAGRSSRMAGADRLMSGKNISDYSGRGNATTRQTPTPRSKFWESGSVRGADGSAPVGFEPGRSFGPVRPERVTADRFKYPDRFQHQPRDAKVIHGSRR